jgi:hypothetical protein
VSYTVGVAQRYHLNVAGDFYVEEGCCTRCGVPEQEPQLFGYDDTQCFVIRQPATDDEHLAMYSVMQQQEFTCIRYAGTNKYVSAVVTKMGKGLVDDE